MATTINIKVKADSARRELKTLAKDVEGIGEQARNASNAAQRAFDGLGDELSEVERQAVHAESAIESIAKPDVISGLDELESGLERISDNIESVGGEAQKAAKAMGNASKSTDMVGEASAKASDVVFDFAKALGSGQGVIGSLEAIIPKLATFTNYLTGPWGAAITFASAILGTLTAHLIENAKAEDEAANATDRNADAHHRLTDAIRQRIVEELRLRKGTAESAKARVEELQFEREVQKQLIKETQDSLNSFEESRESLARGVQETNKRIQEILATGHGGGSKLESERTLIFAPGDRRIKEIEELIQNRVNLQEQSATLETKIAEEQEKQRVNAEEMLKIERQLNAARADFQRKQAIANEQQRKKDEEARREQEERNLQEVQKHLAELKKSITLELDPETANKMRIEEQRQAQLEHVQKLHEILKLSNEEYAQLIQGINSAYLKNLKALQEKDLNRKAENSQNKTPEPPTKESTSKPPEANKAKEPPHDQIKAMQESMTAPGPLSPQQIHDAMRRAADDLAVRRTQGREAELRRQLEERQRGRFNTLQRDRELDPMWGDDPVTMARIAQSEQTQRESEERALQSRLNRELQKERQKAFHQIQSGSISQNELREAAQAGIEATLQSSEATGKLAASQTELLSHATRQVVQNTNDITELISVVAAFERQLKAATNHSNSRKNAQRGGGR